MYTINFDEEVGLLEARLSGFWDIEMVAAFHRESLSIFEQYHKRFPDFPTLCDSRGLAVPSPEAELAFRTGARESAARHRGRTAVVVQSRIAKIQADRRAIEMNVGNDVGGTPRFFNDVVEARCWVLGREKAQRSSLR